MATYTTKISSFVFFSLFLVFVFYIFLHSFTNSSNSSLNVMDHRFQKPLQVKLNNGRHVEISFSQFNYNPKRDFFTVVLFGFFIVGFLGFLALSAPLIPPVQEMNIEPVATYNNNMNSDDFTYEDIIGQGRFRHTFRCVFDFPGEKFICAVRLLNNTPKMRACVEKEARVQGCFEHPHVLPFVYYFYEDKFIYLLMDIAPNGAIRDRRPFLDEEDVAKVVLDTANALMAAHRQGIHHAKINSKKLYFGENDETKIADYGYCLHEERRPHWEWEDVEDLLGVAADLLAFRKLSPLALEFLSTKHGTLANLVNHYWITMPR